MLVDRGMKFHYHFLHVVARPLLSTLFKFEVFGAEHIPSKGGVLIMSNHVSYMDPVFMGAAVSRNLNYMARSTLFRPDIVKRFLSSLNAFPVHLGVPDRRAIRNALRLLKSGEMLLIFPEGTRSHDGTLGEAQPGIGLIAYRTDAVVIPAFIRGAEKVLPRGAKMIKSAKASVAFAKPLDMENFRRQKASKDVYLAIGKEVMTKISYLKNKSVY
ncbi:1-acyl-sn-glycerol-3-phosphate acyltransferase [Candidatus Poribacteria bacterium]|nr:1-acyl-sn-glycerol-3-phosphate acyltransferase [Candidatus Poribacteria bacterium]